MSGSTTGERNRLWLIDFVLARPIHRGISALSSEQRSSFSSNFLKNAAAQAESMHDDPINIEISTAAVQQVPSEDCQSCSRIKAKDFFQCSDTASSIMTQISHFNILVEDETILATFRGASDNFRLSILRKIIKVLLHMASASSQNALWTNRSIATSAALVCKRLEAEFGLDFESAKEDEKLKEVELFLDEDGVRQSMRSIMAGLLVKDANIHQRYPPLKEKPDNHLVISPAWVAGMFDEMSKFFSERLPPNRELHDKAFGSTFWTICGVLDAAVAQPLGRVNPPRKERAVKKVDDAASVTLPHEAQTATRAKAGSGSRATASSSGRGTEKAKAAAPRKSQKAKTFVEQMPEEDEVHRDLDAGSEAYITPNEIQPAQSIDAPNSRRPTRAAAKAASARVAGIALEALEFKRQEEQRAGPSKKRGREAAPIEATENTSPVSRQILISSPA